MGWSELHAADSVLLFQHYAEEERDDSKTDTHVIGEWNLMEWFLKEWVSLAKTSAKQAHQNLVLEKSPDLNTDPGDVEFAHRERATVDSEIKKINPHTGNPRKASKTIIGTKKGLDLTAKIKRDDPDDPGD